MPDVNANANADIWEKAGEGLPGYNRQLTAKEFFDAVKKISDTPETAKIARILWHIESYQNNHSMNASTHIRTGRPLTLEQLEEDALEAFLGGEPGELSTFGEDFVKLFPEEYRFLATRYNKREGFEFYKLSNLPESTLKEGEIPEVNTAPKEEPVPEPEIPEEKPAPNEQSAAEDPWETAKKGVLSGMVEEPYLKLDDFYAILRNRLGDNAENAAFARALWRICTSPAFEFNFSALTDLGLDMIGLDEFFEQVAKNAINNETFVKEGLNDIKNDVELIVNRWNESHPNDRVNMPLAVQAENAKPEAEQVVNQEVQEEAKREDNQEINPEVNQEINPEVNQEVKPEEQAAAAEEPVQAANSNDPWEKAKEGLVDEFELVQGVTKNELFDFFKKGLGDDPKNANLARIVWKISNIEADSKEGMGAALFDFGEGLSKTPHDFMKALIDNLKRPEFVNTAEFRDNEDDIRFIFTSWNEMHPDAPEYLPGEEPKLGNAELLNRLTESIRQKANEDAESYENRVYSELVTMMDRGRMADVLKWVTEIQTFVNNDTERDATHLAAENVLNRFKRTLYGRSELAGNVNTREKAVFEDFAVQAGRHMAELRIEAGKAKESMEQSIRNGEIPGTEIFLGADAAGDDPAVPANDKGIKAVGDAISEALDSNYKRAEALNGLFEEFIGVMNKFPADDPNYPGKTMGQKLNTKFNDKINSYIAEGDPEEISNKRDSFERGRAKTGNAEKYGYEISPDIAKADGKVFSKIPPEAEAAAEVKEKNNYYWNPAKGVDEVDPDMTLRDLNDFNEKAEAVSAEARNLLAELESVKKGSSDNKEYTAMKNALKKIGEFRDRDYKPLEFVEALNDLKDASDLYRTTHDHWWKGRSPVGSHRLGMSEKLGQFVRNKVSFSTPFFTSYSHITARVKLPDNTMPRLYERNAKELTEYLTEISRQNKAENQRKPISPEELDKKRQAGKEQIDFHKKRVDLRAAKENGALQNAPENEINK